MEDLALPTAPRGFKLVVHVPDSPPDTLMADAPTEDPDEALAAFEESKSGPGERASDEAARYVIESLLDDLLGEAEIPEAATSVPRDLAGRLAFLASLGEEAVVGRCRPCAAVEVVQLRVLKQTASGPCGHYALHNLRCALEALGARRGDEFLRALAKARHRGEFWREYERHLQLLRDRADEEGGEFWPWSRDAIDEGDLERSYLFHLLRVDPSLARVAPVGDLYFGFNYLNSSFSQLRELQGAIDKFRRGRAGAHLGIMGGITNHWVSMAARKAPDGSVAMLYSDSNCVNVLELDEAGLLEVVEKGAAEREAKGLKPWSAQKRVQVLQAFKDQNAAVRLVARCLAGETTLFEAHLDLLSRHVMDSYAKHVVLSPRSPLPLAELPQMCANADLDWDFLEAVAAKVEALPADGDAYYALLCVWLETRLRPQTLEDGLCAHLQRLGAQTMSAPARAALAAWARRLLEAAMGAPRKRALSCVFQLQPVLRELLHAGLDV